MAVTSQTAGLLCPCALERDEEMRVRFSARIRSNQLKSMTFMIWIDPTQDHRNRAQSRGRRPAVPFNRNEPCPTDWQTRPGPLVLGHPLVGCGCGLVAMTLIVRPGRCSAATC